MDKEVVFVVALIHELVIAKRHVAYRKVKKAVGQVCLFKAFYCNVVLLIKLLCDAPGKRVKLHAVHLAVRHTLRNKPEKIADATGRFQHISNAETHALHRRIDSLYDGWRGIMRVQRGSPRGSVFILGQ